MIEILAAILFGFALGVGAVRIYDDFFERCSRRTLNKLKLHQLKVLKVYPTKPCRRLHESLYVGKGAE